MRSGLVAKLRITKTKDNNFFAKQLKLYRKGCGTKNGQHSFFFEIFNVFVLFASVMQVSSKIKSAQLFCRESKMLNSYFEIWPFIDVALYQVFFL